MSMIEGVGDEVVAVLSVVFIIAVLVLAWMSTHIRELPLLSLVIFEENNTRPPTTNNAPSLRSTRISSSTPQINETSSVQHRQTEPSSSQNGSIDSPSQSQQSQPQRVTVDDSNRLSEPGVQISSDGNSSSENVTASRNSVKENQETQEMCVLNPADGSNSDRTDNLQDTELRQRRIAFLTQSRRDSANATEAGTSQLTTGQGETSKLDKSNKCELKKINVAKDINTQTGNEEEKINIKIKYLNDSQKNVQAQLTDTIGQFRRANFAEELAADKTVRLIFNGKDLRNDAATLQSSNIKNNSVLHCLVKSAIREAQPQRNYQPRNRFDMSNVMLPMFGILLVIIWYLRFEYRQFFTATATISLIGVSSLYITAMLATFEINRQGGYQE